MNGMTQSEIGVDNKDKSIGDIISGAFNLNIAQMQDVLNYQKQHKVKFGEAAVALGMIKREDVLWALSQQFHYPYANQGALQEISKELVAATQPFSPCAEVFRDVRSQLMLDANNTGLSRRPIAITSPNAGDGKSFFAANLAIAFSQLGGRTLLIDADMRSPRQHSIFNIADSAVGLSGILSGRASTNVIRPAESLPSLYLLPVGTVPPNPLELVQLPAFGLLLQDLLTKFDHVIVDTPAASHGFDTKVIGAACGKALIIGRKNVTRLADIESLAHNLEKNGKVLGMLINDF